MSKIKVNITEHRNFTIEAFGLKNMDVEYNFFYDETNNIRKFRFKPEGGLNIPMKQISKNFVLGGIVYKKKTTSFDFEKLKNDLKLDKTTDEIKLKHIAKGDFLDCLKSEKLNILLDWLLQNDLYIHFSSLNILYWSIVDIIDSVVGNDPDFRFENLNYFKTVFYEVVQVDLENFLKILHKYKYPNIQRHQANKFIKDIKSYILKNKDDVINNIKGINEHSIFVLADILRNSTNKELVFIENNKDYELIDRMAEFYMRPLGLFKNSEHIFDEEVKVIDYFNKFEFCDGDNILDHFDFEESHNNVFIQMSDVVVGLLGKYFEFINILNFRDIKNVKNTLSTIQDKNFTKLFMLLKKSELNSRAFIHYTTALTNIEKERLLSLEFIK